jgi:nitrogenase molybdenum-iron protein alpha chain
MTTALKRPRFRNDSQPVAKLGPGTGPASDPPNNWTTARARAGLMPVAGCPFHASIGARVGIVPDLLHLAHGPAGCGYYAQAARRRGPGLMEGVDSFVSLHLTSDFQEADVVFGGNRALDACIKEANELFPLARGITALSECPVGLIGDDTHAVARRAMVETGKPVLAIRCEGFRGRADLSIVDMMRGWHLAPKCVAPDPRGVLLTCFDHGMGHAASVRQLLEAIGLRVVAQVPQARSIDEGSELGSARLNVAVGLGGGSNVFAEAIEMQFGVPWINTSFFGPAAIAASLRAIAARFGEDIQERVEAVIAAHAPLVHAVIDRFRPRLVNKLFLSFSTLSERTLAPFAELGLRVGTACQGWPAPDGTWRTPAEPYRYRTITDPAIRALLREARPDVVSGCGPDGDYLRKLGIAVFDPYTGSGRQSTWGYDGFARFAADLDRAISAPWRCLAAPFP